jgi:hypothetical protein
LINRKFSRRISIILFFLFCLFTERIVYAQTLIFSHQIGTFTSAKSFSINSAGYIFISDSTLNEIIKLDTLGNIVKTIGGYGWNDSSFDDPADVFATTLNIYVSDKNNNRIQIFDKDLNFISQFSTQNSTDTRYIFAYPTCSAVSTQGDLFILDSDNRRILKFNSRNEFQTEIGGFDAGSYSLSNPRNFTITSSGKILVVDPPSIVMFDQFGNGIKKISLPLSPSNINSVFQIISVNNKNKISLFSSSELETGNINPVALNPGSEDDILDSFVFHKKLYTLTKNSISIYKIIETR